MSYRVLAVLGDSIADGYWDEEGLGWFGRLQAKIAKNYPYKFGFNNHAVSGDRCTDVFHRLNNEILSKEVDILLVAVGVNDLIRWGSTEAPTALSEGMQFETWQRILLTAKRNISRIIVVGVLPVDESELPFSGAGGLPVWFLNKDIEAYNGRLTKWCDDAGVAFVDMYSQWQKLNVPDYLHDDVHPNAKGHQLIAERAFDELEKMGIFRENI